MPKESSSFFLKHFVFGFGAALMAGTVWAMGAMQADTFSSPVSSRESSWRLTEHGWQDSTRWIVDSFVPVRTFELIHPIVWALLVIILAITAMIWSSSEWEFARLLGHHQKSEIDQQDADPNENGHA